MKGSKLGIRLLYYFGGFFVMTIGIALSVKSNLGVSPVSSIPYTMTCVWGIEMGVATVIFHVILVILQMLLMRRRFEFKTCCRFRSAWCSAHSRLPATRSRRCFPRRTT